jgi:hypothetical protein
VVQVCGREEGEGRCGAGRADCCRVDHVCIEQLSRECRGCCRAVELSRLADDHQEQES